MKRIVMPVLLLGLGSAATAFAAPMRGSDTKYQIMQQILSECGAPCANVQYVGLGSSNGECNIRHVAGTCTEGARNNQEFAPMSRFMTDAVCGEARAAGATGLTITDLDADGKTDTGCWKEGIDALGFIADATEATTCNTVRYSNAGLPATGMPVADGNGNGSIECPFPNCTVAGGAANYSFNDWRTVLRIIYGGQHSSKEFASNCPNPTSRSHINEKNCDSDVRRTLVNTWGNMFEGGCTDAECSQLKHAWRRDDASGTTDTFLELLALPPIGSVPFCNGRDSGTGASTSPTPWLGADDDLIRRTCDPTEQVCTGAGATAGTVGNGLVLPIVSPDPSAASYFGITVNCQNALAVAGAFRQVAALPTEPPGCPNGEPRSFNTCRYPMISAGNPNSACMSHANNKPPTSVAGFDGRTYNVWFPRNANGTAITGAATTQMRRSPWYRMHQTRVIPGVAPSGVVCREPDATDQIGCLINASPCSMGFAGLGAFHNIATRKGLGMRNNSNTQDRFPVNADIENLACGDYFPMTRFLWDCTYDHFTDTGAQAAAFVTDQETTLCRIVNDTASTRTNAVEESGFIAVPAGEAVYHCCGQTGTDYQKAWNDPSCAGGHCCTPPTDVAAHACP